MWEFVLERYNYWIVIALMMSGLYIVISRGNLVKTLIGLNLFQTSVFIFYITVGKVAGGTAPILIGGYGGGHDDGHGEGHGSGSYGDAHGSDYVTTHTGTNSMDKAYAAAADHANESTSGAADNAQASIHSVDGLPDAPSANSLTDRPEHVELTAADYASVERHANDTVDAHNAAADTGYDAAHPVDVAHDVAGAAEYIYSNPLPHVLILTAIVVGVATTAVGLALTVRIREAYGTIEEDELEAADFEAEFGRAMNSKGAA